MPDDYRITVCLDRELADLIDEFGGDECRDVFNPSTGRSRNAVYRRLLIDGLSSNGYELESQKKKSAKNKNK